MSCFQAVDPGGNGASHTTTKSRKMIGQKFCLCVVVAVAMHLISSNVGLWFCFGSKVRPEVACMLKQLLEISAALSENVLVNGKTK